LDCHFSMTKILNTAGFLQGENSDSCFNPYGAVSETQQIGNKKTYGCC